MVSDKSDMIFVGRTTIKDDQVIAMRPIIIYGGGKRHGHEAIHPPDLLIYVLVSSHAGRGGISVSAIDDRVIPFSVPITWTRTITTWTTNQPHHGQQIVCQSYNTSRRWAIVYVRGHLVEGRPDRVGPYPIIPPSSSVEKIQGLSSKEGQIDLEDVLIDIGKG